MTKHELIARLARDSIVIEPVANLTYYRVGLHGARDAKNVVFIGLVGVAGEMLVEDYGQVHARVNGKPVKLTPREAEAIVARLRAIFARGGGPRTRSVAGKRRTNLDWPN